MIHTEKMESIPPNSNPFLHDLYNMGMDIGRNVTVMFEAHNGEKADYIIVINKETGERIRLVFDLLATVEKPPGEVLMNNVNKVIKEDDNSRP